MSKIDLTYALPRSRLCFDSKVTVSEDSVLPGEPVRTPLSTVSLELGAGPRDQTISVRAGWFVNATLTLETTDEGRLTSTELDLSGQAGKVVVGVVGAATALAAAVISPLGAVSKARLLGEVEGEPAGEIPAAELEEAAFRKAMPEVAAMRQRYAALVGRTVTAIAQLSDELIADPQAGADKAGLKRLGRMEAMLSRFQSELDRLNGLFKSWRASTQQIRVETHKRYIDLDSISGLKVKEGRKPNLSAASDAVRFVWDELGVLATVDPPGTFRKVKAQTRKNEVLVRIPRLVTISVFERGEDGRAILRERKPQLVMDGACETVTVKLRKSIWTKRGFKLGFSEIGALTSLKHEAESAAAAVATTAGELPATVATSLETAAKARKELGALRNAGLEEELSRVKQEAEAKQQELTLAGLAVTEKDHAELERLKQKAELIEQRGKAGEGEKTDPDPTDVALVELRKQVELQMLQALAAELKNGAGRT